VVDWRQQLGRRKHGAIVISMDGRGSWRHDGFIERLWQSIKYEEVYLRAYDSVGLARASLGRYLDFYPPLSGPIPPYRRIRHHTASTAS
jgi:hypothetical protein